MEAASTDCRRREPREGLPGQVPIGHSTRPGGPEPSPHWHLGGTENELVEATIDGEVARGNDDDGARQSNERGDGELQQMRVAVAKQHLLEPQKP